MSTRNIHMRIVNDHGHSTVISSAILADLLRNYTSDWGPMSTSVKIDKIEDEFADVLEPKVELFNKKVGYITPEKTLDSLLEEVYIILRDKNPKYTNLLKSFNNLEKTSIYFILKTNPNRSVEEVFDLLLDNLNDSEISKRDIMINLLSEAVIPELTESEVDPINGLFKALSNVKSHSIRHLKSDDFKIKNGKLEFKDYTFPIYNYNVHNKLNTLPIVQSSEVRNYTARHSGAWLINNSKTRLKEFLTANYSMYGLTSFRDYYPHAMAKFLGTTTSKIQDKIKNYRDVILKTASKVDIPKSDAVFFKTISESYIDFPAKIENKESRAPLTMVEKSTDSVIEGYLNKSQLKVGNNIDYSGSFSRFKTFLAYYNSDLNMWLTSDKDSSNSKWADYIDTTTYDGMLPSNGKVETKGYFSNISFIQNSITRVLFPKILEVAQGREIKEGKYSSFFNENIDTDIYYTIYDSIVNNSFIFTDKYNSQRLGDNYERIPNRVMLNELYDVNKQKRKVNTKASNLYEFMINSLVMDNTKLTAGGTAFLRAKASDIKDFQRVEGLYKGQYPQYNMFRDQISDEGNNITLSNLKTGGITYLLDQSIYKPTTNWLQFVSEAFYGNVSRSAFNKLERQLHFFKLPVHNPSFSLYLNSNMNRVTREHFTDVSDLDMFEIEGISTADFTYGEKALLEEYIEGFRTTKNIGSNVSRINIIKDMLVELKELKAWVGNRSDVIRFDKGNRYYQASPEANPAPPYTSTNYIEQIIEYYKYLAKINMLKSKNYFPEILKSSDILEITKLLERAYIHYSIKKTSFYNTTAVNKVKVLLSKSALRINYLDNTVPGNTDGKVYVESVSTHFLNNAKLILSELVKDPDYQNELSNFRAGHKTGRWLEGILPHLINMRTILLDNTKINNAIKKAKIYASSDHDILKDLDTGLFKLIVNNYFSYITGDTVPVSDNLNKQIFVDNQPTGIIRYYMDVIKLAEFMRAYYELLPKYVEHINKTILPRFINHIEAIKTLPTWDYESLHRRDTEKQLKESGGVNKHDYNVVWNTNKSNLVMMYKKNSYASFDYRVSSSLYSGGLSAETESRVAYWTKFVKDDGDAYSASSITAFKVPMVKVVNNNAVMPSNWKYNDPGPSAKVNRLKSLETSASGMDDGLVASISSFKYVTATGTYENIGVPLILFGDQGKEWNLPNTTRTQSFSLELEYLNSWYTDEGYSDGGIFNSGGGEAYNPGYKSVSRSPDYKRIALGQLDFQAICRFLFNMESSPMGHPYTVMNYYSGFTPWNGGYQPENGDFPYSTESNLLGLTKVANKYELKYVFNPHTSVESFAPVYLNENGADGDITNSDIHDNFYLRSLKSFGTGNSYFANEAIFDIMNRNIKNRFFGSQIRWLHKVMGMEVS